MSDGQSSKPPDRQPAFRRSRGGRRSLLLALTGIGAGMSAGPAVAAPRHGVVRAAAAPAEPFPDSVNLLVAGPRGGRMDRWADAIGAALCRALPAGTMVDTTPSGGADGVTAANQFDARVAPDGETVLLLPGETPLAWLTGDPRARFDAAGWVPVMAGVTPGVLASRVPAGALRPGSRLLVAASVPAGPELPALLGLDLMGIVPLPQFGLGNSAAALRALRARRVDALFVTGPDAAAVLGEALAAGAAPLFALGGPADGALRRDPLPADLPTAAELAVTIGAAPPSGALAGAWRAVAAATQIEFALVLPRLTSAALVAQWRCAGAEASQLLRGQAPGVRLLCTPDANAATAAVAADAAAMLELRRWLASRFNWAPG